MEIKEHRLRLFVELYKQEFGITLTKSEAHEKASRLLHYALMCLKPLAKIDEDDIMGVSNVSDNPTTFHI
jgi:hypothetical protein